jgi:hypothetical protein
MNQERREEIKQIISAVEAAKALALKVAIGEREDANEAEARQQWLELDTVNQNTNNLTHAWTSLRKSIDLMEKAIEEKDDNYRGFAERLEDIADEDLTDLQLRKD